MNAEVPYSRHAVNDILTEGEKKTIITNYSSCSESTAILIAEKAYQNALECAINEENGNFNKLSNFNIFGVSCTAALVSDSPKKGCCCCCCCCC